MAFRQKHVPDLREERCHSAALLYIVSLHPTLSIAMGPYFCSEGVRGIFPGGLYLPQSCFLELPVSIAACGEATGIHEKSFDQCHPFTQTHTHTVQIMCSQHGAAANYSYYPNKWRALE